MDIVDFWKQQAEKWNDEQKCGFCWDFGAPLIESQLNIQQSTADNKCCVKLFLTDLGFNQSNTYSQSTGFNNDKSCEYSYNLWVLMTSKLGVNNYNEITGHSIDVSNWMTIYRPLLDCLGCELVLNQCEILGFDVEIKLWKGITVFNYSDMNYSGWKIQSNFKVNS